ncbi:hypothetical protein KEM54_005604, partial [Ascosphaera aggregata]
MRYSFISAALVAAVAVQAQSTIYKEIDVTITSCPPEITNCPARSHSQTLVPTTPAAETTSAVETTPAAPSQPESSTSAPAPSSYAPASSSQPVVSSPTTPAVPETPTTRAQN